MTVVLLVRQASARVSGLMSTAGGVLYMRVTIVLPSLSVGIEAFFCHELFMNQIFYLILRFHYHLIIIKV